MKITEIIVETAAWQKKSGKNKNGGLNKKGVASYRKQHPGSKLKTAVTKKPSELKAGSKDAKRRKSFCARMKGMKKHNTSAKTKNDPNSRINKSLRKWHCESVEQLHDMLMIAEATFKEMLPAKNQAQLYNIKQQITQPPQVQQPVAPTPTPTTPTQPQKPLAQLQSERAKLNQVLQLKGQIEQLTARAERTRMGIPRGLAADLEVDYSPQSEKDYDDLIVLYQRQIKQLTDYIARQRNVYRESVLKENKNNEFIKNHIQWVADQLDIKQLPTIKLLNKPMETTFGMYSPENKCIYLVTGGRHPIDVLRTLAHELTHYKQDSEDNLPPGAGETGTDQENEANANAGIIMRDFADAKPEYFGLKESLEETPPEVISALNQAAQKSGYANWEDVLQHPKSPYAKMTVAKLASTILKIPQIPKPTKTF